MRRRRLRNGRNEAVGVGDVALASHATYLGGDFLGLREIDVEHGDFGAQPCEFACGGFAQARGASRDQCRVSMDIHVISLNSWGEA